MWVARLSGAELRESEDGFGFQRELGHRGPRGLAQGVVSMRADCPEEARFLAGGGDRCRPKPEASELFQVGPGRSHGSQHGFRDFRFLHGKRVL